MGLMPEIYDEANRYRQALGEKNAELDDLRRQLAGIKKRRLDLIDEYFIVQNLLTAAEGRIKLVNEITLSNKSGLCCLGLLNDIKQALKEPDDEAKL